MTTVNCAAPTATPIVQRHLPAASEPKGGSNAHDMPRVWHKPPIAPRQAQRACASHGEPAFRRDDLLRRPVRLASKAAVIHGARPLTEGLTTARWPSRVGASPVVPAGRTLDELRRCADAAVPGQVRDLVCHGDLKAAKVLMQAYRLGASIFDDVPLDVWLDTSTNARADVDRFREFIRESTGVARRPALQGGRGEGRPDESKAMSPPATSVSTLRVTPADEAPPSTRGAAAAEPASAFAPESASPSDDGAIYAVPLRTSSLSASSASGQAAQGPALGPAVPEPMMGSQETLEPRRSLAHRLARRVIPPLYDPLHTLGRGANGLFHTIFFAHDPKRSWFEPPPRHRTKLIAGAGARADLRRL